MKILILEDNANRIATFTKKLGDQHILTCVDTAQDVIDLLDKNTYDVVFLDHDLGGEVCVDTANKNTGSEVVRWVTQDSYCGDPVFIIHSLNIPAAESMEHDLVYAGFETHRISFIELVSSHFDDPAFLS